MKFTILIFGCQMNYSDSARIKAVLINCGFNYTENIDDADIIIFDTCSVKQKAEDKITGKLMEIPKNKKIWITGCMIQHNFRNEKLKKKNEKLNENMKKGNFLGVVNGENPEILGLQNKEMDKIDKRKKENIQTPTSRPRNLEGGGGNKIFINNAFNPTFHRLKKTYDNIELFFRIDDVGFLPLMLKKLGYKISYDQELINEYCKIIPEGIVNMDGNPKTAFIPISTGCNQFCSYCIVPYSRGLEKYFEIDQILKEVDYHLGNGVEEIVLLGQIVNKHPQFIEIIKEILKKPKLKWLRYTSPYPNFYTDEILKLHETESKLCPHIHIPLQSGSDDVLKKMFRGYNCEQFKTFITKIKNLNRNISLTTDIIVGFPDESDDDFQKTLEIVKYAGFDMIYIGIYSPRPGTFASKKYEDNISKEIKRTRRDELNDLLTEISQKNNDLEIGTEKEILVNKITEKNIQGYTKDMKKVLIKTETMKNIKVNKLKEKYFGKFIKVKIQKAIPFKLYGEILSK